MADAYVFGLNRDSMDRATREGFAIVPRPHVVPSERETGTRIVPHGSVFTDAAAVVAHLRARASYGDSFACAALLAGFGLGAPVSMPAANPDDGERLHGILVDASTDGMRGILWIPGIGPRECSVEWIEPAAAWEVAAAAGWKTRRTDRGHYVAEYGSGAAFQTLPHAYETAAGALAVAFPRVRRGFVERYHGRRAQAS